MKDQTKSTEKCPPITTSEKKDRSEGTVRIRNMVKDSLRGVNTPLDVAPGNFKNFIFIGLLTDRSWKLKVNLK